MDYLLFAIGILLLVKGADWLVTGASSLADRVGISKLTIGLTVASLGTSLPELGVSLFAAARGSGDLALGNIIGSCISNLLLILGIISIMTSLKMKSSTSWKEIPFAFLAALLLGIFALRPFLGGPAPQDNFLARSDGIVLLLFLAVFMYYVFELAKKSRKKFIEQTIEEPIHERSAISILLLTICGAIGLYIGGEWTVGGAASAAESLGLSEFLVSATIIAIGTSLPELTTAIVAVKKDKLDLAVGNVIGSNILNIFLVLGLTSLISPILLPAFMIIDTLFLVAVTFFLFIFMFTSRKHELDRWEGVVFLIAYSSYLIFLIIRG